MTPVEKAKDLIKKFGKELASKVVDEIISALEAYDDVNDTFELQNMDGDFRYWDKVKHELNKSEIVTEYRDGTIQVETFKSE